MNILECYQKYILLPIENNLKELYAKYYNRKLFILKKFYKKLIDEYQQIYYDKLKEYDKLIMEYYK